MPKLAPVCFLIDGDKSLALGEGKDPSLRNGAKENPFHDPSSCLSLSPRLCSALPLEPGRSDAYNLRSNKDLLLAVPRTRWKTFGDTAFAHAGPSAWNSPPKLFRDIKGRKPFKQALKTHLFRLAYFT
ncbi:predicted protein [Nematostella vectensis]|uniref:Uncharacterized protein n=1 Tax=Nematostella vectensis TaxID=45351 RepID=A7SMT9_NEMVE|nr:predicted protein [Nematostella vectensis]|eukprot:XP_001627097.1 predicted protein [Nematostella vectensis]